MSGISQGANTRAAFGILGADAEAVVLQNPLPDLIQAKEEERVGVEGVELVVDDYVEFVA